MQNLNKNIQNPIIHKPIQHKILKSYTNPAQNLQSSNFWKFLRIQKGRKSGKFQQKANCETQRGKRADKREDFGSAEDIGGF